MPPNPDKTILIYLYDKLSKNPSFLKKFKQKKSHSLIAKGLEMSWLPRQNDYRTFCMSDQTENVYQKLEEIISIC